MLESLHDKVAGLKGCNFIKKRLQHKQFPVDIADFLKAGLLGNISSGCFDISEDLQKIDIVKDFVPKFS